VALREFLALLDEQENAENGLQQKSVGRTGFEIDHLAD
jgi:hypothetical protein